MGGNRLARDLTLPLLYEAESAANLLGHGVTLLSSDGGYDGEPSPIFAVLATGSEKLLKLTLGLVSVDEVGAWPTFETMKSFGHDIVRMHLTSLDILERRLTDLATAGTSSKTATANLAEVRRDPVLALTLDCLSDYAREGRFHNLDALARRDGLGPSPKDRWEKLEVGIMNAHPDLQRTMGTPEFSTLGRPGVMRVIGRSIVRWWRMHQHSWNTGAVGSTARTWSMHIDNRVPSDVESVNPGLRP